MPFFPRLAAILLVIAVLILKPSAKEERILR